MTEAAPVTPMPLPAARELLRGDVALVTGAARGNGLAIARGLAAAGAAVALVDTDAAGAETARQEIAEAGDQAIALELDVGDAAACRTVAEQVEAALGPVSILVNNAGVLRREPIESDIFEESWDEVFRVNVTGSINMVRSLGAQLRATRGRVINIGSIASFRGARSTTAYVSSKGAVLQMTKALAAELAPDGIRVNGIAPGRFVTRMTEAYRDDADVKAAYLARTPLGRYGEPEDLVGPALFLASSWSAYVTGVMLPVDGGFLAV